MCDTYNVNLFQARQYRVFRRRGRTKTGNGKGSWKDGMRRKLQKKGGQGLERLVMLGYTLSGMDQSLNGMKFWDAGMTQTLYGITS